MFLEEGEKQWLKNEYVRSVMNDLIEFILLQIELQKTIFV